MKALSIAILTIFLYACTATKAPSPSYYAYQDAPRRLEKNVSTYEQVRQLYGECAKREDVKDGYRCVWKNSNTVVRSTEQFGASSSLTNFDPGRSVGRYTYTTVYTSTMTAVFSNDNILRALSVSNNIEK